MIERKQKLKKAVASAVLLCFTSLTGAQPLYAVPANTQLPDIAQAGAGVEISKPDNTVMNIHQEGQTAVNQWNNFSIGADATVNFTGPAKGFNSFNYVKNGPISEIYGQLNALGGNIFIANPAGVQIGNSAQINVGSLYVTTRELSDEHLRTIGRLSSAGTIGNYLHGKGTVDPAAELMSLGSITTANSITFDGGRVVLDTDRLFTQTADGGAGGEQMGIDEINKNLVIRTDDADNVVLGYTAYDDGGNPAKVGEFHENAMKFTNIYENGTQITSGVSRYMWVEDFYQLQAMGNYTDGWFALRNAIDANYTQSMDSGKGFNPIGDSGEGAAFTGRFDGLGYHIFGLTINRASDSDVGLFGSVEGDAIIRNVTLNGGSITGGDNVGSIAGSVSGNALVENITNTADIEGKENVGGIIGSLDGTNSTLNVHNFVNTGSVSGTSNVGGIVGKASGVTLDGRIYNLGAVTATNDNAGGIIGYANNTDITGGTDEPIYNQLGVEGAYNVGGIVGFIEGDSSLTNVANYGDITAMGSMTEDYAYHMYNNGWQNDNENNKLVNVANVGGIAGKSGNKDRDKITINNVENTGDVTTAQYTLNDDEETPYYIAGNVGGIVGRAQYTDITNAENTENLVAGAHNVGGIAGYFADGTIDTAGNNGGEITATGARSANGGFAQETVNYETIWSGTETVNIGNIGGVVGYLYGANAHIRNAANRGDVHSAYIDEDATAVPETAEAANVGGIAGKVSMLRENDEDLLTYLKGKQYNLATISNSYNTGNVAGYTGVGGIAGQTVRGSVAGSYNLGTVRSTRIADPGTVQPLNMGGVVGDTGVATDGSGTVIYDVYNAGQIGDDTYTYLGRHVGGVAGRLGGTLEKAYNTGDIYNGYSVTGGVVGYWVSGNIKNVFNTGNVTAVNYDLRARNSLVGGIVGAALSTNSKTLSYAYNLGTLRSFIPADADKVPYHLENGRVVVDNPAYETVLKEIFGNDLNYSEDAAVRAQNINVVGGIIGGITETSDGTVTVNNVYTTGNIYAGRADGNGGYEEVTKSNDSNPDRIGAIWGTAYTNGGNNVTLEKAYFIKPLETGEEGDAEYTTPTADNGLDNDHIIAWNDRMDSSKYKDFSPTVNGISANFDEGWRMYSTTTPGGMETLPMLNAFTPNSAKDQSWQTGVEGIGSVQYGTAANPLLTIINADGDVTLDWDEVGISGAGGLAVYGGGLTVDGFNTTLGSYFNGIIFSDGDLTVNAGGGGAHNLGSGSRLYGQNVLINAGENDTTLYGSVTSTNGDISVSGNNVSVIGELTAKGEGETTQVEGIARNGDVADSGRETIMQSDLINPEAKIPTVERAYSHITDPAGEESGSITVTATENAEVLYGNMGDGRVTAAGDFSVSGKDSVYIDSDLHIGGDLNLSSDGEIVLDLSNMGSYDSVNEKGETITGKENLHRNFLDHFKNAGAINVSGEGADGFMIALDMWDDGKGAFDLDKYDVTADDYGNAKAHELADDINALKITLDGKNINKIELEKNVFDSAQKHTYIWIDGAEQLNGIQAYKDDKDTAGEKTNILTYNFALKDDIDASQLVNYNPIGSGTTTVVPNEFTGTFDGRGFRIIGLNANLKSIDADGTENTKEVTDAGIFGTIGDGGTVKDLGIYSSHFTGEDTAGAVAGVNKGTITGVTTFGNTIRVTGTEASTTIKRGEGDSNGETITVGAAGGIAGVNRGQITNVETSDTVIASESTGNANMTVAGGVVGINKFESFTDAGQVGTWGTNMQADVTSTSAVISDLQSSASNMMHGLGGIVGINESIVYNVAAFGATNGSYGFSGASASVNEYVGGIIGVNYSPFVYGAYNESAVIGASNVGGIVGKNEYRSDLVSTLGDRGNLNYVVNAGNVTAIGNILGTGTAENAGGIAGMNYGVINNGRNTAAVTGVTNVGGMVGLNAENATLSNLSNAIAATITGNQYVGGIAGSNAGEITAESVLTNEGAITGVSYVGGIAGENAASGEIRGSSITEGDGLTNLASVSGSEYVGGVAGLNAGTIENTNSGANLVAIEGERANGEKIAPQYFGGVTGLNNGTISNVENTANLTVEKGTYVGGITGQNGKNGKFEGTLRNEGDVSGNSAVSGIAGANLNDNVLQGTRNEDGTITRLQVTNTGTVSATTGGASGIFYNNSGKISDADLVNEGKITGTGTDATGGLFGVNTGDITNSTLTNRGTVTGGTNVGGLIGVNTGDVTNSSLINEVGGSVTGTGDNVGGLIGKNNGTITGGRNDADTMYADKIYNNGTVSGSSNVGGLIGANVDDEITIGTGTEAKTINKRGKLTAGYNTGAVTGTGSNVGGIAGTNAGEIDQVFNTVMTADATADTEKVTEEIHGTSNVGGLVGNNLNGAVLSNAYNDTETIVATDTNGTFGNAVGTNGGKITNIYATNDSGELIGENTNSASDAITGAYSFVAGDKSGTGFITGEDQKQSESYIGFDFTGADGTTEWKNYDGYNTPLLKVFLTQAQYDGQNQFTYNGKEQGVGNVDGITAADGRDAYNNVNSLLQNLTNIDAGTYTLWSSQIWASNGDDGFDPNNLGYDIDFTYNIAKAQLSVSDILASITYGGKEYDFISGGELVGDIYSKGGAKDDVKLSVDFGAMDKEKFETHIVADSDYAESKGNRDTANVLRDENGALAAYGNALSFSDITLTGDDAKNYVLVDGDNNETHSVTVNGDVKVTPAHLDITLNDAERTYGDTTITNNSGKYTFDSAGLVNGDENIGLRLTGEGVIDGALTDDGSRTQDAGTYEWYVSSIPDAFDGADLSNYDIVWVNDGKANSIVNKRGLTVEGLLGTIEYGSNGGFTLKDRWSFGEKDEAGRTGIAYDDDYVTLDATGAQLSVISGSKYDNNRNDRDTADVVKTDGEGYGVYADSLSAAGLKLSGSDAGNYYIIGAGENGEATVTGGIEVTPAQLTITADNQNVVLGALPVYTGTTPGELAAQLVNGDRLDGFGYEFVLSDALLASIVGTHPEAIGVLAGGKFYGDGVYDWSGLNAMFANYDVYVVPGSLIVTPPGNNGYIHSDGWDRVRNFRERKAELHFVQGGMEYEEGM